METMADSRSIDFAKTASIDMMALNNKVVNMRQTVKRTKVHVINKLTKNISKLKKKKGSDEQRQQNLQKAERLIEEIDSIKKLKPDKVSKYALANTLSFTDISKKSTSPGPRALARLADHTLLVQIVTKFREEHPDWKDLAAYLLVKQTGRRFKTKKQKQIKLSHSVENINASETMTKAYIETRFGQEGLKRAEQNFERKRRRKLRATSTHDSEVEERNVEDSIENKRIRLESDSADGSDEEVNDTENFTALHPKEGKSLQKKASPEKESAEGVDSDKNIYVEKDLGREEEDGTSSEEKADSESAVEDRDETSDDSDNSDANKEEERTPETSEGKSDVSTVKSALRNESKHGQQFSQNRTKTAVARKECVVKEFDLEKNEIEANDESSESGDNSSGEADDDSMEESIHDSVPKSLKENSAASKKSKRKKEKSVPDFLTKEGSSNAAEVINDPFFAGSDDDDDEFNDNAIDSDPEVQDLVDDENFGGEGSRNRKTKSLFYNPHSHAEERPGGFQRYEKSSGDRGFHGRGRGSGFRGRGRGRRSGFEPKERGGREWGRDKAPMDRTQSSAWRGRGGHQSQDRPQRGGFTKGAPSKVDHPVDVKPKEKLHPSWEASKRRKAEQSGIMAFQGKKITFDDD